MKPTDMKAFMFPVDIWGIMMNFDDEEIGHIMKAVFNWIYKGEYTDGLTKNESTTAIMLINRIADSANNYLNKVNGFEREKRCRKRKEIESNEQ